MADAPPSLRAQQFALSRHLRDPAAAPPPGGIEDRRLAVYRELLYNNLQGLLAGNFPVIRGTLGDEAWHALVRAFYAGHRCHTPLFTEIGREFVRWLEQRLDEGVATPPRETPKDCRFDPGLDRGEKSTRVESEVPHCVRNDNSKDVEIPPWLPELAHYEWVELALQISDAQPPVDVDAIGVAGSDPGQALLDGIPVLSPQAWALAYRWPVHRIGPEHQPSGPPGQPTLLLVRRDAQGEVRFALLSPLAFRLLELLGGATRSGRDCLRALAHEAGVDDEVFLDEGRAMLARMHDEGTLLGIRSA